jgi:hypothetical protein
MLMKTDSKNDCKQLVIMPLSVSNKILKYSRQRYLEMSKALSWDNIQLTLIDIQNY